MNNTVKRSMVLLSLVLTSLLASAQSTELCQGEYYTEKQGADKLSALEHRLTSRKDGESHADNIKPKSEKGHIQSSY